MTVRANRLSSPGSRMSTPTGCGTSGVGNPRAAEDRLDPATTAIAVPHNTVRRSVFFMSQRSRPSQTRGKMLSFVVGLAVVDYSFAPPGLPLTASLALRTTLRRNSNCVVTSESARSRAASTMVLRRAGSISVGVASSTVSTNLRTAAIADRRPASIRAPHQIEPPLVPPQSFSQCLSRSHSLVVSKDRC